MATHATTTGSEPSDQELEQQGSIWARGLYMLLFVIIARVAEAVVWVVLLIQFVYKATTHQTNEHLTLFGQSLSRYYYDIIRFQTFNSEEKPFPFSSWPRDDEPAEE